eukprot:COSAG02_NODE_6214_length_3720_cov_1.825186_1_plen_155_part_00
MLRRVHLQNEIESRAGQRRARTAAVKQARRGDLEIDCTEAIERICAEIVQVTPRTDAVASVTFGQRVALVVVAHESNERLQVDDAILLDCALMNLRSGTVCVRIRFVAALFDHQGEERNIVGEPGASWTVEELGHVTSLREPWHCLTDPQGTWQ